jgi:uncharacterized protein YjbJ (UPF0337 family)
MNWDRVEGAWKQRRGKAVHHWGKMMNDDLAAIAGKYEELVGKLQERYGIATEEATERIKDFRKSVEQLKKSNHQLLQRLKSLQEKEKVEKQRVIRKGRSRKTVRSRTGD